MLADEVNELINSDVEEIIKSSASLDLLKIYSILYLNGAQPRTCASSIRNYYFELKKTGIMKAEKLEAIKNRTCKPKWNGLRLINGDHFSNEWITDEEAIKLLQRGYLNESDFDVLPDGFKKEANAQKTGTGNLITQNQKPKNSNKPKK